MANLRTNNLSGEQGQNAYRGSVFFDGDLDGLQMNSSDFAFGTGDFTVEGWFWWSGDGIGALFDSRTSDNNSTGFFIGITAANEFYTYGYPSGTSSTTYSTIPENAGWNHFAVTRDGSNGRVFLNGQQVGSTANTASTDYTDAGGTVGQPSTAFTNTSLYRYKGYISNIRVHKGEAIYTSNFTPPTTELKATSSNCVLLCCQDSDNPLQEQTGKTITPAGRYEHLSDTELVTNGSGTTTTGWTNANTSTFTVEDGMIKVTRSGGTGPTAYQTITTVAGQHYTVSANIQYVSGNYADLRVYNGSDSSGTLLKFLRMTSSGESSSNPTRTTFIAESTSTTLFFVFDDDGNTGKFSQISVKAADGGEQPKVIPPYGVDAGNTFGGSIQQSTEGYMYFPTGRTEERGRGRAVFGGGANPSITSVIDYVHVPTDGNAIKFGDLSAQRNSIMAVSSQTRGIWGGGNPGTVTNTMEFVTLSITSNTTDFGDLTVARMHGGGVQNSTRGVFMTGYTPSNVNTIDFITMASTGNATDFGDVIDDGWPCGGGRSSSTRGVLMGHGDGTNRIQFITIMTTGNSEDFGDLNTNSYGVGAGELSDGIRGIAMGGSANPADHTNVIDFITIAEKGNATEFGDLTVSRRGGGVGCTLIKGICAGGRNPSDVNIIDSVIIQTTGNATEFGDLSEARAFQPAGCSDSHGGLT